MDWTEVRARECLNLIQKYRWLHECMVHDFFCQNHWLKLPSSWRKSLQDASANDLASLVAYWEGPLSGASTVWPLELMALRSSVRLLAVPRGSVPGPAEALGHLVPQSGVGDGATWPQSLRGVYRRHVKPKKEHEILRMAELVRIAARSVGVGRLVDVGSGVGHLSRLLSFGHDIDVVSIDANGSLTEAAKKFDRHLSESLSKEVRDVGNVGEGPLHKTEFFEGRFDDRGIRYGIVGLHTCGDLGASLVRLFAADPSATMLQVVGCCHMKIDESFPMSESLRSGCPPCPALSYVSKELACHAAEVYVDRLRCPEDAAKLKVHCYRALLELLLERTRPDLKHASLRSVARSHNLSFEEYAVKATARLRDDGLVDLGLDEPHQRQLVQEKLQEWWRVVAFFTVRLFFAPLIETAVLLDRVLYLRENGCPSTALVPIFDPFMSPRNSVLVSFKGEKKPR